MEFVKKGDEKSNFDFRQQKTSFVKSSNFVNNSFSSPNFSRNNSVLPKNNSSINSLSNSKINNSVNNSDFNNSSNFFSLNNSKNYSNSSRFSEDFKEEEIFSSKSPKRLEDEKLIKEKTFESKYKEKDFLANKKFINFLEKLIFSCIFLLVAGLPIFFLDATYQGINFEKQYYFYFLTFIGIIAWGTKSVLNGSFVFRRTLLDWFLLGFLVIYSFSTLFSVDRYHSFFGLFINPINGLVSVFTLILAFYLLVINVDYLRAKKLIFSLVGVGSFVSIWVFSGFISILIKDKQDLSTSIYSKIPLNLVGFSFFSLTTYLVFLIPLIIVSVFLIDESNKKKIFKKFFNLFFYFVLFTILFNISILFNYVYWIPFLIALGIFVIFILGKVVIFPPKIFYTSLLVFLVMVTFFVIKVPVLNSHFNVFFRKELTMSYNTAWEITQNSIKNKPFLGSGPGTYGYNFSLFRSKSQSVEGWELERFSLGKGLFLENLSTIGILGTILLVAIILLYLGYFFHNLNRFSHKNKVLSLGFFISNLIIIFSAVLGFLDGSLLILSVLITALSINVLQKETEMEVVTKTFSLKTSPQYALLHSFLFLVVVVSIIFSLVTFTKLFLADINIRKALNFKIEKNESKISEYFFKALEKNKNEGNYYYILSVYCFDFLNNPNVDQKQNLICNNNLIQFSLLSAKLMPNDVLINQTAGLIMYKKGGEYVSDSLNEARNFYKKSLELEPKNPFFEIALGEINLTEVQISPVNEENLNAKKQLIEEAKKFFEISRDKFSFPDQYIPIYEKISVANENLGNIDEAIKNLEIAVEKNGRILSTNNSEYIINQQMNYGFNLARLLMIRAMNEENKNAENDLEKAEFLLKQILQVNNKEINSMLSLGLLYEKTNRIDEAISQYNKILEILPAENKSREQVQKLIDNINSKKAQVSSTEN